jgi:hypothetical protein
VTQPRFGLAKRMAASVVFFAGAAFAQKVIGPEQIPCSEEVVRSNFELKEKLHVLGALRDSSDAPFVNSKIVLKTADGNGKFVLYRAISTNEEGHFDLGLVDAGSYRLLPSPNRGFKQPVKVVCKEGNDCEINLVLQVNPTEKPFAGCPIQ